MILKKVKVKNKENIVLDTEITKSEIDVLNTTLLLGENGVGKSFFLKMVADIFIYINAVLRNSKPAGFQYDHFEIEYVLNNNTYFVFKHGKKIYAVKNNKKTDLENIDIPSRVLAVSYLVNDKFIFSKSENSGKGQNNDMYKYLGVRSSSNSTFTSSIEKKFTSNIFFALKQRKENELFKILRMIGFDNIIMLEGSSIRITLREAGNEKSSIRITLREAGNENNQFIENFLRTEGEENCSVIFKKSGTHILFENLSSGEKHLLFAFVGILCEIKKDSLILIDEPEISLHPEWQIKYVSKLQEIFKDFSYCHFLLASHSHYFVSDLPQKTSSIVVFRNNNGVFESELLPYDTNAWSAENIIYNVFGLRTSRNYYFEADLGTLIKEISEYDGSDERKEIILTLVSKLKRYSLGDNDPLNQLINEAQGVINV